ncbi:glycogenin-1-like isoform X1 [Homarus americanus]|uniref:glycogenin-1-like isoform X1 n=2 Tax=Homarus americanus TaxID=6706 RepID=UPI001C4846AE|nr:glycogenin-1-like isoform X1 [Homarus americanus]
MWENKVKMKSHSSQDTLFKVTDVITEGWTMSQAYVTLATNDGYAIGALVLGHSLRSNNTTKDLVIMIAPAVSEAIKSMLESVFNKVIIVDVLDSRDSAHLSLLKRPELGVTFTKLHCWTLTQYSKCVFLDADMLCVQNPDDLFSHPELTAVCDIGWPDCFNSGMFVLVPSVDTYGKLLQHAETSGSFDGGDQGLLNSYFPNWQRVSFIYNMVASATYTYLPAYKQFGANAKLVHFLGALKPWQHRYDAGSGSVHTAPGYEHLAPYLNSWWALYNRLVKPGVPEMDLQRALEVKSPVEEVKEIEDQVKVNDSEEEHENTCASDHVYNGDEVAQQLSGLSVAHESLQEGQARWERGEPDYLGRDSFANIQAYIDSKIKNGK